MAATVGLMVGGTAERRVDRRSAARLRARTARRGIPHPGRDVRHRPVRSTSSSTAADLTVATAGGDGLAPRGHRREGRRSDRRERRDSSLDIRSRNAERHVVLGFGDRDTWRLTLPADAAPRPRRPAQRRAGDGRPRRARPLDDVAAPDERRLGDGRPRCASRRSRRSTSQLNAGSLGLTLPQPVDDRHDPGERRRGQICAPRRAGLRLHTGESIIASYDYAGHGLVQDGSTWTTPGFDSAAVRIELETNANAGSFTLDPEEAVDDRRCIGRATTGCSPAWPAAWPSISTRTRRSSGSSGPC